MRAKFSDHRPPRASEALHHCNQCSDRPRARVQEQRCYAGRWAASACLPTMFQAIKIDGEPYWDGGYSGNPTITPLIRECRSQDTILVQINPVERERSPRSASDILNRLNEVSFNAVLLKELRMIALLRQVADPGNSEGAQWVGMRIHRIASETPTELGASSKLNAEWEFFSYCAMRGESRRKSFWRATHRISGTAPLWISMSC